MSGGGSCKPACDTPAPLVLDEQVAAVMRGNLGDLQRAAEKLDDAGIDSQILNTTEDIGGGCCKPVMYLIVAKEDEEAAREVFNLEWRRGLTDEQAAALEAAASIVVDPESGEMTCPACLTTFGVGPAECPDCGLSLA